MARALYLSMTNATTETALNTTTALNATMENATMENAMLTPSEALALATAITQKYASQRGARQGLFGDGELIGRNEIQIWFRENLNAQLAHGRTADEVRAAVAPLERACREFAGVISYETTRVTQNYSSVLRQLTGKGMANAMIAPSDALAPATEIRIWLLEALDAKLSACRNSAEVYAAVDPLLVECMDIIEDIFAETSRVTACRNS